MERYSRLCSRMRNWDFHRLMTERKMMAPRPGFELLCPLIRHLLEGDDVRRFLADEGQQIVVALAGV